MADLRLLILASRFQNAFFTELAHVLVEEIRRLGVPAHLLTEPAEIDSGDVLVALPPHEYVALEGDPWARDHGLRARTIGISAEQPGSSHFDENIALAASFGATFDFSAHAVAAYQRAGVVAHHLAFGWTPAWDRFHEHDATGPEVLFMGCATERRLHALSGLTRHLWSRRSRLIISDNATPNHRSSASFLTGDDKRSLLATTAVLVNIHQGTAPYFEWLRAAEAAHCGAVLLSEPSLHPEPFVPGEHFEAWTLSGMSSALDELLDDEDRLGRLRLNAYRMLREHPFQASVAKLLTVAEELPRRGGLRSVGPRRSTPLKPTTPTPWEHERGESDILRQAIREIRLDLAELRRAVLALERGTASADNVPSVSKSAVQQRAVTAPRVSVLMALYNHAPFVTAALDSVALNDFLDVELIVVDDGSTDHSRAAVDGWMRDNPDVRATLVSLPANRGLPVARNLALAEAAGELCFVLDADNELVPSGLCRLVEALDADPEANFAYGVLQRFDSDGPVGLLGFLPWLPERLRYGNYIDAMALVRTSALRRLGGFTTDRRLHGWEDYDLWCRLAEEGSRAAHVPTVVGRYRTSNSSMLSLTNVSVDAAFDALRQRAPRLMAGLRLTEPEPSPSDPFPLVGDPG